jgi:tetratricopeptide (TPR) repeat protein
MSQADLTNTLTRLRGELNRARDERRLGNHEVAETILRELQDPLLGPGAGAHSRSGSAAKSELSRLAAPHGSVLVELGRLHEIHERPAPARDAFLRAAALFARALQDSTEPSGQDLSDYGFALSRLGQIGEGDEQLRKGEAMLRRAADLAADDLSAVVALAENLEAQGRLDPALAAYRQAASILAYVRRPGWAEKALALLDHAERLHPGDPETLCLKGEILLALGQFTKALEVLEEARRSAPRVSPALAMVRAAALQGLRRHEEALEALGETPPSGDEVEAARYWWRLHVDSLFSLGRYDEAAAALRQAAQLRDDDWIAAKHGQILLAQGQAGRAIEVLEPVARSRPALAWARSVLVEAYRACRRYDEALALTDELLRESVDDPQLLAVKGRLLRARGDLPEAVRVLEDAVRRDPTITWAYTELGSAYWYQNRFREALQAAETALERDPTSAWAWRIKGSSLHGLHRPVRALEALDRGLDVEPGDAWTLGLKGSILSDMAYYVEALEALDRAALRDPRKAWIQGLRGFVCQDLGEEHAGAMLEAYEKAHELERENIPWRMGIAEALLLQDKVRGAQDLYQKIVKSLKDSRTKEAFSQAGWCLYRLKRYDEAVHSLQEALALDDEMISAQFDLALALVCWGKPDRALIEYRRGLSIVDDPEFRFHRAPLHVALEDLRQVERTDPRRLEPPEMQSVIVMLKRAFDAAAPQGLPYPEPQTSAVRFAERIAEQLERIAKKLE